MKWCRPNLRKKYNLLENAWKAHFILMGRRKRMVEPDFSAWRPKHPEPLQSPVFHRGLSLIAGKPLLITQSHFSKTVTMQCAVSLQRICRGLIAFLSIGEICCCVLGRGDAVGADRKLPAHPRVLALTMPRRDKEVARPTPSALLSQCRIVSTLQRSWHVYLYYRDTARHIATNTDRAIWDIAAEGLARRLEGL